MINAARCIRGTKPAFIERLVAELTNPKVDWVSVMERFVSEKCKDDYSWRRPNTQLLQRGIVAPGMYSEDVGPLVFAVDTSGSVDDKLLTEFFTEINHVFNAHRPRCIDILYCDTRIAGHDHFEQGELVVAKPRGGGGTDFCPVFKWVEENLVNDPPLGIIYLTDMFGSFPSDAPSIPTLWLSWSDIKEAPFGEVINVN